MTLSPVFIFVSLFFALQIHTIVGQLGNRTFTTKDILLRYRPHLRIRGNITRIVGGQDVNIVNVPWQVALFESSYFICGGSIISRHWVLTAAHCISSGGKFAVRVGSPNYQVGGQVRFASLVVVHSLYDSSSMNHDLAMIQLTSPFTWTDKVKPVYLPYPQREIPDLFFVSGWGTTTEGGNIPLHVKGVTIRRVGHYECQQDYKSDNIFISKYMICAASPNKDSCQGDSGGPLVNGRIQHGIVSFGIGCARSAYPGIYTKVRMHYNWINEVITVKGGQGATWV